MAQPLCYPAARGSKRLGKPIRWVGKQARNGRDCLEGRDAGREDGIVREKFQPWRAADVSAAQENLSYLSGRNLEKGQDSGEFDGAGACRSGILVLLPLNNRHVAQTERGFVYQFQV